MEAATKWTKEDEETLAASMAPEGEAVEPEPEPSSEPDGEETEPETEPEVEARIPSSETVMLERDKKLNSEATRHENALKKVYGDDFEHRAFCPLCIGEGFLEPIPPGGQPDEIWEAVKALSGRMEGGEYEHPEELMMCARCNGWGNVSTSAKNEHTAVIPCSACESRGYFDTNNPAHRAKLGIAPEPIAPPVNLFPVYHDSVTTTAVEAPLLPPSGWVESGSPGADGYGRWPGHPRYGINPASTGGAW